MDLNLEPRPENPVRKKQIALAVSITAIVALLVCMFTRQWQRAEQSDRQVAMGLMSIEMCAGGRCTTMSNKEFVDREINGTIADLKQAIGDVGRLRGFVSRDLATDDTYGDGYDEWGRTLSFEDRLCSGDLDGAYQRMLDEERVLDPRSAGEPMATRMLCNLGGANPNKIPSSKSSIGWLTGWITLVLIGLAVLSLGAAVVLVAQGKFFLGPIAPTSWAILCLFLALIAGCIFVASNPTRGENLDLLFMFKYDASFQLGVGWSFWVFGVGVVLGIVGTQMLVKFKPAPIDHFQ